LEEDIIEIGHITHFFPKISVAVVELTLPLAVGDNILVKGPTTDFQQTVDSMQIDRKAIQRAEGGQSIGLSETIVREKFHNRLMVMTPFSTSSYIFCYPCHNLITILLTEL
jgi:hypothetical protein